MQPTADFYRQAQSCIEQVVRDYRPIILENHGKIDPSIKADATPVTVFDQELEQLLRKALLGFDSSIGLEGEEFGREGNENTFWLIDPIDGTENFVRGLPFVRNMVTLIHDGKPMFTLVYRPITDELFIASDGNGTFKDGQPVRVSSRPLERTWVDISFSSFGKDSAVLERLQSYIKGYRTTGEFTYVIEGKIDAQLLYKAGGGAWDYAPRALLFKEAGGKVTNVGSDSYDIRNNDVLMANPAIFDELMATIVDATTE